ncbi:hypothetical protein INR49_017451 [Caranx melampygus]|nr:hypothetical protein INR49_017451 [Caranx melampygus]
MERPRMNCVPDLKYGPSVEAWIRGCDFSKGDFTGALPRADPRIRTPSWVADLEDDDSDLCSVVDSQLTLQDLRLQFAEQISLLAQERRSSDMKETLLRDNRIDSLIQKADRVLNSLSQSCDGRESSACPVSPVNTEELLLRSPSRSSSVGRDSALAAGGSTDALTETGAQTLGCSTHGNSIQKQPGPVEALKQMLFRLQAMEGRFRLNNRETKGPQHSPTNCTQRRFQQNRGLKVKQSWRVFLVDSHCTERYNT